MGRTVPTFVQLVEEASQQWAKFRRALRREDQPHFDQLFRSVRSYTQAATYQCHDNPMEAILLSMALDLQKRLHTIEQFLRQTGMEDETQRMDPRSLPQSKGNDAVADRRKPEPSLFE
jgi:hypothetical protein